MRFTLACLLALGLSTVAALAGTPSIPVWSGAPVAAPGDDGFRNINGAVNHFDHGKLVSHSR